MEGLLKLVLIFLFLYAIGSLSKKNQAKMEKAFKRLANLFKGTPEKNVTPSEKEDTQTGWKMEFKDEPKVLEFLNQYGISRREWEIVQLICNGKSNKEIEDKLFISMATVKDHVHNIYSKTGVKNRVQLTNLVNNFLNDQAGS